MLSNITSHVPHSRLPEPELSHVLTKLFSRSTSRGVLREMERKMARNQALFTGVLSVRGLGCGATLTVRWCVAPVTCMSVSNVLRITALHPARRTNQTRNGRLQQRGRKMHSFVYSRAVVCFDGAGAPMSTTSVRVGCFACVVLSITVIRAVLPRSLVDLHLDVWDHVALAEHIFGTAVPNQLQRSLVSNIMGCDLFAGLYMTRVRLVFLLRDCHVTSLAKV